MDATYLYQRLVIDDMRELEAARVGTGSNDLSQSRPLAWEARNALLLGTADTRERAARAEELLAIQSRQPDGAPKILGLELNQTHHGDLDKVLADPTMATELGRFNIDPAQTGYLREFTTDYLQAARAPWNTDVTDLADWAGYLPGFEPERVSWSAPLVITGSRGELWGDDPTLIPPEPALNVSVLVYRPYLPGEADGDAQIRFTAYADGRHTATIDGLPATTEQCADALAVPMDSMIKVQASVNTALDRSLAAWNKAAPHLDERARIAGLAAELRTSPSVAAMPVPTPQAHVTAPAIHA